MLYSYFVYNLFKFLLVRALNNAFFSLYHQHVYYSFLFFHFLQLRFRCLLCCYCCYCCCYSLFCYISMHVLYGFLCTWPWINTPNFGLFIFHGAHKFIVHLCKKIINFVAQRAIITSAFQFELLALCQPEKNSNNFISSIKRRRERERSRERESETHTETAIL